MALATSARLGPSLLAEDLPPPCSESPSSLTTAGFLSTGANGARKSRRSALAAAARERVLSSPPWLRGTDIAVLGWLFAGEERAGVASDTVGERLWESIVLAVAGDRNVSTIHTAEYRDRHKATVICRLISNHAHLSIQHCCVRRDKLVKQTHSFLRAEYQDTTIDFSQRLNIKSAKITYKLDAKSYKI